jgi:hypothetical protein
MLFFDSPSFRGLYAKMDEWQKTNRKRFQSLAIQKEGDAFCCIALANPSEVVIVNNYGTQVDVEGRALRVKVT